MSYKNKEKDNAYNKEYRLKNKEKRNAYDKKFRKENPEYFIKWNKKNKKKIKLKNKIWYQKNKSIIREKRRSNPTYRLINNLRRRVISALKGKNKSANTKTLLSIPDFEFLWNHLEKSFKPGMTRKNHGKWHLDHIMPCVSFDLTKPSEQRKCFHYTNLQPLWASENLAKGSKIS